MTEPQPPENEDVQPLPSIWVTHPRAIIYIICTACFALGVLFGKIT